MSPNSNARHRPHYRRTPRRKRAQPRVLSVRSRKHQPFTVISRIRDTQTKAPAWLLELTHQLRNFRQWRLIIKPDQTIDLDYLASLALQAQRRARPYTAPPQPTLFALEPLEAERPHPAHSSDMQPAINQTDSNAAGRSAFTVITGNNQPSRPNAIILPEEILTIQPDEFLHDYLGRVAAAAVQAAIFTCGTPDAAFIRLGSMHPQDQPSTVTPRPTLVLAPSRALKPIKQNP